MALLDWNSSYSVKVASCDDDHKRLFALLKDLHQAIREGIGTLVTQQIVDELADYTLYHFTREELLLRKTSYPDFFSHRAKHQEFVKKVQEFQTDLHEGKQVDPCAVAEFLNSWLAQHIKQVDQRYSVHLNAHGVR